MRLPRSSEGEHLVWQVLVVSPGKGMQPDRMRLASELWGSGISAEFGYGTHHLAIAHYRSCYVWLC